jgi:hypothetical protein
LEEEWEKDGDAMSGYRFLQPAYINGVYYVAGSVAYTADIPGGTLPIDWVPGPYVDPIDSAAITATLNAGPQNPVLARQQWTGQPVSPPSYFWKSTPVGDGSFWSWQLTGPGNSAIGSPICAGAPSK